MVGSHLRGLPRQLGRLRVATGRPTASTCSLLRISASSSSSAGLGFRHFAAQAKSNPQQTSSRITAKLVLTELKAGLQLVVTGALVVAGLSLSSGFVIETVKTFNPPKDLPGCQVQLTSHRDDEDKEVTLHVIKKDTIVADGTTSHGNVTVILDGSAGETSFDWEQIADKIASFATVVAIDRPGLGFSSPGKTPRTAEQIAKEYLELFEKLSLTGKVVLVGHGNGAYNMRKLACLLEEKKVSSSSDDVSAPSVQCGGLVLVDPSEENFHKEVREISPLITAIMDSQRDNVQTVFSLSHVGLIRLIHLIQRKKEQQKFKPESFDLVTFYAPSPKHRLGVLKEFDAIASTEESFRHPDWADQEPDILANVPKVFVTHGRADVFDALKMKLGPQEILPMETKWIDAQNRLSNRLHPDAHLIASDAGTGILYQQPQEIVRSVLAIVNELGGNPSGGLASLQKDVCELKQG